MAGVFYFRLVQDAEQAIYEGGGLDYPQSAIFNNKDFNCLNTKYKKNRKSWAPPLRAQVRHNITFHAKEKHMLPKTSESLPRRTKGNEKNEPHTTCVKRSAQSPTRGAGNCSLGYGSRLQLYSSSIFVVEIRLSTICGQNRGSCAMPIQGWVL